MKSLLDVILEMTQSYIRNEVAKYGEQYSLCLDSTQDVSVKEQTSIIVRYVNEYGPVERLLDILETPRTTGKALHDHTIEVLNKLGYTMKGGLLGYALDGVNMQAEYEGLQAHLKMTVPLSVRLHCYANRLNLVMEECCDCVVEAVTFFSLLRECPVIISESHIRVQLWKHLVQMIFPEEAKTATKFVVKLSKTR